MDISVSAMPGNYAMVFEGIFNVSKSAVHNFKLSATRGARLYLDGKLIISNSAKRNSEQQELVKLEPGKKKMRLEYFAAKDKNYFKLAVSATNMTRQYLSSEKFTERFNDGATVMLESLDNQAVVYRNFLKKY